ncbi:hypothetical protein RFZ44_06700, partial [Acinetobacter sp. 163]|nr:hypothetical protein [Acinetobacter sp. 163]
VTHGVTGSSPVRTATTTPFYLESFTTFKVFFILENTNFSESANCGGILPGTCFLNWQLKFRFTTANTTCQASLNRG